MRQNHLSTDYRSVSLDLCVKGNTDKKKIIGKLLYFGEDVTFH